MTFSFLPQLALIYILIFARVSSIMMLLPGIGETYVSTRVRLIFALLFTLVLYPILNQNFPVVPSNLVGLMILLFQEILIGLFIGMSIKLFMTALNVTGNVIAMQTGLGSAMSFDPSQGTQAPYIATMMNLMAVTLIFITDLHHFFFKAMIDSYQLFPTLANDFIPVGDFTKMAVNSVAKSFYIGLQLSAPFILYGVVFNVGLGIMSKLMPQVQIYFVAMPANIAIGFLLIMLLISSIILSFLDHFKVMMEGFVL